MKYKLTTFGGLTKVVEIVEGATKGATVGAGDTLVVLA